MIIVKKHIALITAVIIVALVITLPKSIGLFPGIIVTYTGFLLLNLYPFLHTLRAPRPLYYICSTGFVGLTGYGWATIIIYSGNLSFGLTSFFGILFVLAGIIGFFIAIHDMVRHCGYDGLVTMSLYTKGIFSLIRHPHAVCWLLFLLGLILVFKPMSLALSFPVWFIGFISYAALEEKFDLVPRFGDDYLAYCRETPALIPNRRSFMRFMQHYHVH